MQDCKYNEELCSQLIFISRYYTKHGKRFPYGITYSKAVKGLSDFSAKNQRKIRLEDYTVSKIKGIGKGIGKKITQYLDTGVIDEYLLAKNNKLIDKKIAEGKIKPKTTTDKAIDELSQISYIGVKSATELVEKYGFTTIASLEKAVKDSKTRGKKQNTEGPITIATPNGKTTKLTKNQRKMLFYHKKLKRLQRAFIKIFEETTRHLLKETYGTTGYNVVFAGSYRRGAETSGDIDIIIKSTKFTLEQFVKLLKDWGVIFDTLTSGKSDFKGLGRCPGMKDFIFRIDILFTTTKNWIPSLTHFTGNDTLNRMMRLKAKELKVDSSGKVLKHGAILSQNGLFVRAHNGKSTGVRIKPGGFKTEKALFKQLGVRYLTPTERGPSKGV
jgi:DNA polymerase/3'-5' exonuclease PolX